MNNENAVPPAKRPAFVDWLVSVNTQVSSWAASMTWWRLLFLFIIIMIAGSLLSEQLNLRHDRIKVERLATDDEEVQVSINEKDGIVIKRGGKVVKGGAPGRPVSADATPTPATPTQPGDAEEGKDSEKDGDKVTDKDKVTEGKIPAKRRTSSEQVFTARGLIGDLGSALMIIAFAYLVASKVIVRKVAQADAKVRSAEHAAEHEAMERRLVQARLQVLQAQVEPHFLFNTLSAIDYLIETDPPRASQMQKALVTYLRGALPQMRQESSTLGRELRLIRSFLDLLKMRMEDRLDVAFEVPEGAESAEFPPMMLQSLVENAIKHGIEPKPEGGKVTVAARIQNGQLWVEVKDTGIGIPNTDRLEGPTSGTGLGLQNIRERLAMLFPGKSRLILVSDDTVGTSVKIIVPYQVGPDIAGSVDGVREEKPA